MRAGYHSPSLTPVVEEDKADDDDDTVTQYAVVAERDTEVHGDPSP